MSVPPNDQLSKQQELLLNQLIYFDSMRLEHDNQDFKPKLYDLFFKWRKDIHKNQEEDLEKIEEPARK
jgi:hypothetical protein